MHTAIMNYVPTNKLLVFDHPIVFIVSVKYEINPPHRRVRISIFDCKDSDLLWHGEDYTDRSTRYCLRKQQRAARKFEGFQQVISAKTFQHQYLRQSKSCVNSLALSSFHPVFS